MKRISSHLGARGFIAKTDEPAAMAAAIDLVLTGGETFGPLALDAPALSPRQAEVLMLLTDMALGLLPWRERQVERAPA